MKTVAVTAAFVTLLLTTPASGQTISYVTRDVAIQGGSCDGAHAADVARLWKTSSFIRNIGSKTAVVVCHFPHDYDDHAYRVIAEVFNGAPDVRFRCDLVSGFSSQFGSTPTRRRVTRKTDPPYPVYMLWGLGLAADDIGAYLDDGTKPFLGGPLSIYCELPPKSQLNYININYVHDLRPPQERPL